MFICQMTSLASLPVELISFIVQTPLADPSVRLTSRTFQEAMEHPFREAVDYSVAPNDSYVFAKDDMPGKAYAQLLHCIVKAQKQLQQRPNEDAYIVISMKADAAKDFVELMFSRLAHANRYFRVILYVCCDTNEVQLVHALDVLHAEALQMFTFSLGIGKCSNFTPTFAAQTYKNVQFIGDNAFASVTDTPDFSNLTSLTHIGHYAFENVTATPDFSNLTALTHIGHYAFENVMNTPDFSNLTALTLEMVHLSR